MNTLKSKGSLAYVPRGASYRAWFGASFAPIWACLIFLVGPELGIKQPTQVWLQQGKVRCTFKVHLRQKCIFDAL